jgi:tellurite methyltransferase
MKRKIVTYYKDGRDDWVAELDCYHGQDVRHDPPFTNRPWVASESGREAKLGLELNCLKCDRLEQPEGLEEYKRTPVFSEMTIPKGLLKQHSTKEGAWGKICVLSGSLAYTVFDPEQKLYQLEPGTDGVIAPQMLHQVEALEQVSFYVQFLRKKYRRAK